MTYQEKDNVYVLPTYKRNYTHFTHGVNATLFDSTGRDYIDFTSGIAVNSVGHAHPRLVQTISEQASKVLHLSNLYLIDNQADLAAKMVTLSGRNMRVFFANSGAEANEGAIKMARKYGYENGGRHTIITLEQSFHGRTLAALKATAQPKMHMPCFEPFPEGFMYAASIEEAIALIDENTAAIMFEVVQGEGGVTAFPKEDIMKLCVVAKAKGALVIVDEVQTGVYRSGEFLASQLYGIEPDIITFAKGLGGGIPIGAIMTRLVNIFSYGDHGSTFGGNPLSCAAALTVLDILEEEYNAGRIDERIIRFEEHLNSIVKEFAALVTQTSGLGLLRGLRAKDEGTMNAIIDTAFKKGVIVLKAGLNTVRFAPALTITKEEIDEGFVRFISALRTLV